MCFRSRAPEHPLSAKHNFVSRLIENQEIIWALWQVEDKSDQQSKLRHWEADEIKSIADGQTVADEYSFKIKIISRKVNQSEAFSCSWGQQILVCSVWVSQGRAGNERQEQRRR